jgi:hypothetical protein
MYNVYEFGVCDIQFIPHTKRTERYECDETVFPRKRTETYMDFGGSLPERSSVRRRTFGAVCIDRTLRLGRRRRIRLGYLQERAAPVLDNSVGLASVQPWSTKIVCN